MKQLVFRRGVGVVLSDAPDPDPGPGEVLIAPAYSYISAGTELSSLAGARTGEPGSAPDHPSGYSQAGTVLAVGDGVSRLQPGDRVVAVGAGAFHAGRTVVGHNLVVPVPDDVALSDAATAAMFCFAIEAVHKSRVRLGEKVLVFGAGMMGQFASRLYQLSGADVAVADGLEFRRKHLPAGLRAVGLDDPAWDELAAWAKPYGIEHACVAFGGDATSSIERLKPLLTTAPDGVPHGRIVFPGGAKIQLMMASAMGNIELLSSAKAGPGYRDPIWEHGADYPAVYAAHTARRNVETMMSLLRSGSLEISGLITHTYPFLEAPQAYADLQDRPDEVLSALLSYDG